MKKEECGLKTVVIFKSKYGSSKQYAAWLADALRCKAESVESIRPEKLSPYDVIVYVGGLYAGRVNGFAKLKKHLGAYKKLVLCMVGMTNPSEQDKYHHMFLNNVPEQYRDKVTPFALRGNQLFTKMSFLHRVMMKVPKSMAEKIPLEQRTEDDQHFLAHFGEDICYVKRENIYDVVEYTQGMTKQ